jgi:hypothetical protein
VPTSIPEPIALVTSAVCCRLVRGDPLLALVEQVLMLEQEFFRQVALYLAAHRVPLTGLAARRVAGHARLLVVSLTACAPLSERTIAPTP